ncbi:MAG: hypothetical protein DCC75_01985 [Proteobacteria bacterium]|nr:MAG: hypothetical protein DCC75_01985 [Pseudomonadota bacterium]
MTKCKEKLCGNDAVSRIVEEMHYCLWQCSRLLREETEAITRLSEQSQIADSERVRRFLGQARALHTARRVWESLVTDFDTATLAINVETCWRAYNDFVKKIDELVVRLSGCGIEQGRDREVNQLLAEMIAARLPGMLLRLCGEIDSIEHQIQRKLKRCGAQGLVGRRAMEAVIAKVGTPTWKSLPGMQHTLNLLWGMWRAYRGSVDLGRMHEVSLGRLVLVEPQVMDTRRRLTAMWRALPHEEAQEAKT